MPRRIGAQKSSSVADSHSGSLETHPSILSTQRFQQQRMSTKFSLTINPDQLSSNRSTKMPQQSLIEQDIGDSQNFADSQFLLEHKEEERFRILLSDFFMPPWEKWRIRARFPFKLLIHTLLLITVTTQLVLFGSLCSTRVSYSEQTNIAFRHLYLKDWEPQYETLPYPPSTGIYAVYSRGQFFEHLGYALQNFNLTEVNSVSGYTFSDGNRTATVCVEQNLAQKCADIDLMITNPESLSNAENITSFFADMGIVVNFSKFQGIILSFFIDSPSIHHLDWDRSIECFRFNVQIQYDNSGQTGQVVVSLHSEITETICDDSSLSNQSGPGDAVNRTNMSPAFRRVVHIIVDLLAFNMAILSAGLCIKALFHNIHVWRMTTRFFDQFYGIQLQNVFFKFVSPWFFLILVSNILIISGSIFKLVYNKHVLEMYSEWSYLLGLGTLLVWLGMLRYVGFSSHTSLLLKTITRSLPGLLRFCVCALILYFAFVFSAWVIIGPFHMKFRTFTSTLECLFSLINGDDMYVTFSIIGPEHGWGIFIFSRVFLYLFITLFIYVVLNIFVTIIFEAYEEVKVQQENGDRPISDPLWHFIYFSPNWCASTHVAESNSCATTHVAESNSPIHCSTSNASWRRISSSSSNSNDGEEARQRRGQELGRDLSAVCLSDNEEEGSDDIHCFNSEQNDTNDMMARRQDKPVGRNVSFMLGVKINLLAEMFRSYHLPNRYRCQALGLKTQQQARFSHNPRLSMVNFSDLTPSDDFELSQSPASAAQIKLPDAQLKSPKC